MYKQQFHSHDRLVEVTSYRNQFYQKNIRVFGYQYLKSDSNYDNYNNSIIIIIMIIILLSLFIITFMENSEGFSTILD